MLSSLLKTASVMEAISALGGTFRTDTVVRAQGRGMKDNETKVRFMELLALTAGSI